jgi:hypothetical protein
MTLLHHYSLSVLSFGFAVGCISACVPEFEEDNSTITQPRVLAVQAVPAEAQEDEEITLTALVAAPTGDPSAEIDWALCVQRKPLAELGPVDPACLDAHSGASVLTGLGTGRSVTAAVPNDACRLFGPKRPEPKPGEPAGRPVDPDPTGGFYQPVIAFLQESEMALGGIRLNCGLSGASREVALEYAERYHPNSNPELNLRLLRRDGSIETQSSAPWRVEVGEPLRLEARWSDCGADQEACTGAEHYVWFEPTAHTVQARRETVLLSWYSSLGDFDVERTGVAETDREASSSQNGWRAPAQPGNGSIWVVIADDRGGVSWQQVHIEVVP